MRRATSLALFPQNEHFSGDFLITASIPAILALRFARTSSKA
jgi:hypothetical protein